MTAKEVEAIVLKTTQSLEIQSLKEIGELKVAIAKMPQVIAEAISKCQSHQEKKLDSSKQRGIALLAVVIAAGSLVVSFVSKLF